MEGTGPGLGPEGGMVELVGVGGTTRGKLLENPGWVSVMMMTRSRMWMILAESGHNLCCPHVREPAKRKDNVRPCLGGVFQQNSDLPQPGGTAGHSGMISELQNPTCTTQE